MGAWGAGEGEDERRGAVRRKREGGELGVEDVGALGRITHSATPTQRSFLLEGGPTGNGLTCSGFKVNAEDEGVGRSLGEVGPEESLVQSGRGAL